MAIAKTPNPVKKAEDKPATPKDPSQRFAEQIQSLEASAAAGLQEFALQQEQLIAAMVEDKKRLVEHVTSHLQKLTAQIAEHDRLTGTIAKAFAEERARLVAQRDSVIEISQANSKEMLNDIESVVRKS